MRLEVLRVFADERGEHGNPLGVIADGAAVPRTEDRQAIATELGYSETVFVDDATSGRIRIFTPGGELPLAGHPLVGIGWLLQTGTLRPPAGDVPCWREGDATWIRAHPDTCPPWSHVALPGPAAVEALTGPPDGHDFVQLWAFDDETTGTVRARVFAPRVGVAEDEACGSASILLAAQLQRALTIRHGRGSIVHVRPGPDGTVELGGRVVSDHERAIRTP